MKKICNLKFFNSLILIWKQISDFSLQIQLFHCILLQSLSVLEAKDFEHSSRIPAVICEVAQTKERVGAERSTKN